MIFSNLCRIQSSVTVYEIKFHVNKQSVHVKTQHKVSCKCVITIILNFLLSLLQQSLEDLTNGTRTLTQRGSASLLFLDCRLGGSGISADDFSWTLGLSGEACVLFFVFAEGLPPLVCWSLAVVLAHKDHVVSTKEKSSPLSELEQWPQLHHLRLVLVGFEFLLVLWSVERTELPPDCEHTVWETTRGEGATAQRVPGAGGSVPRSSLCCPSSGRETLHASWASFLLVRDQERHPLCTGLPPKYSQCRARDHDAHMVHLQSGYSYHVHTGSTRGLSLFKHLRSNRGWWVCVEYPGISLALFPSPSLLSLCLLDNLVSPLCFEQSMTFCLAHAVSVSIIPCSKPSWLDLPFMKSFSINCSLPMPLLEVPLLVIEGLNFMTQENRRNLILVINNNIWCTFLPSLSWLFGDISH